MEALAATLAQLDVPFLRTQIGAEPLPLQPADLVAALAQHPLPRVRLALIPLFLRHPELAEHVEDLVSNLPPPAAMTLRHFYTAAVYLQRLWDGKLILYLGAFPLLPDYFGQSHWNLSPLKAHYGEAGLRELAEVFHEKTGDNWLSTYRSTMDLFLSQLRLEANG